MNKFRIFLPILIAISLIGVPAYAAETAQPQGMVAKSKQAVSNARKKAQAQFKESVDRFNRCIRGKCTKTEALKAARDVAITAAVAVAGMYVTGAAMEASANAAARKFGQYYNLKTQEDLEALPRGQQVRAYSAAVPLAGMIKAGQLLQVPGKAVGQVAASATNAKNRIMYPVGTKVYFSLGQSLGQSRVPVEVKGYYGEEVMVGDIFVDGEKIQFPISASRLYKD